MLSEFVRHSLKNQENRTTLMTLMIQINVHLHALTQNVSINHQKYAGPKVTILTKTHASNVLKKAANLLLNSTQNVFKRHATILKLATGVRELGLTDSRKVHLVEIAWINAHFLRLARMTWKL